MSSAAPRHRDAFGLAGWLFADLLLALTVLFLAASPPGVASVVATPSPSPMATPTPRPTPTASPTPSPSPSPTACTSTVLLRKHIVNVPARRAGVRATDAAIKKAFSKFKEKQVGLLLTFVHGSTPGAGVGAAKDVNRLISKAFPQAVNKSTVKEAYFNNAGSVGNVRFVAYLIADNCKP